MPLARDEHENILNQLLNPELEHSARTELLQQLRVDYSGVLTDHENHTKTIDKLQKDNSDLVISNSKLFRQLGNDGDTGKKKEEEQKTFSESITLEQIERR